MTLVSGETAIWFQEKPRSGFNYVNNQTAIGPVPIVGLKATTGGSNFTENIPAYSISVFQFQDDTLNMLLIIILYLARSILNGENGKGRVPANQRF